MWVDHESMIQEHTYFRIYHEHVQSAIINNPLYTLGIIASCIQLIAKILHYWGKKRKLHMWALSRDSANTGLLSRNKVHMYSR